MLDRCLEDASSISLLTETLAKPSFKKIITNLKNNSILNAGVFDISTVMTEIFLQPDEPVHSNIVSK